MNVDHGQLVGRSLKDVQIVMSRHELAAVGGWARAGETGGGLSGSPTWVRIFRIGPGSVMNAMSRMSPPHVRLPPLPRPRLQPHTLVALVSPVPEPSHRLVQEIQPGHAHRSLAEALQHGPPLQLIGVPTSFPGVVPPLSARFGYASPSGQERFLGKGLW